MEGWTIIEGVDVTGAFRGITTPLNELLDDIQGRGWEPTVKWQGGQYVASAKNPHGETVEATGPDDSTAASNLLIKIMRTETIRSLPVAKLAQWQSDWSNNLEEIAKAYASAPVYDPKAAPAWKALADDSSRRAAVIREQLQVEVTPEPEPYQTPQEMCEDVHKNRHFFVSSANSQHPMWSVQQNIDFRIVHDVLGHCVSGGDFGWQGENQACRAHFPLLTPEAQKALFTECIGQTAAAAYFRSFMPQKVVYLDDFIDKAQEQENPANHQGVHPSQTLAPTQMPQVQPSTPQGLPWATQTPHEDFTGQLPVFGSVSVPEDPNQRWTSGIDPMPDNAYLWGGDPLQAQAVTDNAMKIDTGWEKFINPITKQPDRDSMRQAIINAFRAVLLSPRKDLRWNAIHYQDLQEVPATVTDPKRYWDTLEDKRIAWNVARGYHADSHKPYFKELQDFKRYVAGANPTMNPWEAEEKAQQEFMHIWMEEEERVYLDPKNERLDAGAVERKVANEVKKRLKTITRPDKADTDFGHEQLFMASRHGNSHYEEMSEMSTREASGSVGTEQGSSQRSSNLLSGVYEGSGQESMGQGLPISQGEVSQGPRREGEATNQQRALASKEFGKDPSTTTREVSTSQRKRSAMSTSHPDEIDSMHRLRNNPTVGGNGLGSRSRREEVSDDNGGRNPRPHSRGNTDRDSQMRSSMRELSSNETLSTKARLATQLDLEGQDAGKYGAFMGTHLRQIAQLSEHADQLLDAALEDVQEHDGTGHHFRSSVLSLRIPGVGPKVASFAWLLLQPATSQLATIDTHMMDVLGHDYAKNMNDRDYFKYERELAAGRDASGYGNVPLGQFQWGMWDNKRTGPGSHQDHSSLKVIAPTPHTEVNWAAKTAPLPTGERYVPPDWWEATQPARQQVADDWDQNVATQFARDQIPRFASRTDRNLPTNFARDLQEKSFVRKNASSQRIPWILWGDKVWVGGPGETFMNLARREMNYSMEDVLQRLPEYEFSAGVYDPSEDHVFAQDTITRPQEIVIRQHLGVPHEHAPSFFA
jgi:hypothetical protein